MKEPSQQTRDSQVDDVPEEQTRDSQVDDVPEEQTRDSQVDDVPEDGPSILVDASDLNEVHVDLHKAPHTVNVSLCTGVPQHISCRV